MNVPTRRKRRAGILPASFVAAGWKPALLFQLAILAFAITWAGLVAPFCFAQSATAQEKTAADCDSSTARAVVAASRTMSPPAEHSINSA